MTRDRLRQWKRKSALATISAGFMAYVSVIAPAALAQLVPRQLPPDPPPELPSVSEYSLPPGDSQESGGITAEGPVEENAAPPQVVPSVVDQPEPGPSPVPATPVQATQQPDIAPIRPSNSRETTAASSSANAPQNVTQNVDEGSANQTDFGAKLEEPTPGFSTNLPSSNSTGDTNLSNDEPIVAPSTQETGTGANIIFVIAAMALFLASLLGIYFWRRKAITKPPIVEPDNPAPASPPASDAGRQKPRPRIYSPPGPAKNKNSPQPETGYVTSKIPVNPTVAPKPAIAPKPDSSVVIPKAKIQSAEKESAAPLQIAFIAQSASSTLLNAVLSYEIQLTNQSGSTLSDIRLFGAMMQADSPAAKKVDENLNTLLHEILNLKSGETLSFSGDMRLPLNAIRPISFKSQALFIPLTRFRTIYLTDNEEQHEQTAAFIIGQEYQPRRPKMAPFRLDLGPRIFESVGHRRLTV